MTSGRVKSAAQALPQENLQCNLLSQSEKMLNWQKIAFRCVIVWGFCSCWLFLDSTDI